MKMSTYNVKVIISKFNIIREINLAEDFCILERTNVKNVTNVLKAVPEESCIFHLTSDSCSSLLKE